MLQENNKKEIDLRRLSLLLICWKHSSVGSLKHVQVHNCFRFHYNSITIAENFRRIQTETEPFSSTFSSVHWSTEMSKYIRFVSLALGLMLMNKCTSQCYFFFVLIWGATMDDKPSSSQRCKEVQRKLTSCYLGDPGQGRYSWWSGQWFPSDSLQKVRSIFAKLRMVCSVIFNHWFPHKNFNKI